MYRDAYDWLEGIRGITGDWGVGKEMDYIILVCADNITKPKTLFSKWSMSYNAA